MTSIKDMPRFTAAEYLGTAEARADYMAAALEGATPSKSAGHSTLSPARHDRHRRGGWDGRAQTKGRAAGGSRPTSPLAGEDGKSKA
ncbi:hypothetical protein J5J10_02795 [Ciceribacter sp. L1K23]|uniref:hypothetical protein n=1 Tax=Ciceribacter sp. L1K23 TaxID=2820276 RepID=UPI001B814D22|nr:hypothetical protein [Ciceribacter sp. L1K23]MBR0554595.1 hypothetical protein [Ciceribacter sp. L1K23]